MNKLVFYLLFFGFTLHANAQHQGIEGKVFVLSGNQMPGPGHVASKTQGALKEIYIYKVAYAKDATKSNGFYTKINTKLISKVLSKADGSFKVKLLPGEYSLFVNEPQGLFANLFDKDGKINPVVVKLKEYSKVSITIDYDAFY